MELGLGIRNGRNKETKGAKNTREKKQKEKKETYGMSSNRWKKQLTE